MHVESLPPVQVEPLPPLPPAPAPQPTRGSRGSNIPNHRLFGAFFTPCHCFRCVEGGLRFDWIDEELEEVLSRYPCWIPGAFVAHDELWDEEWEEESMDIHVDVPVDVPDYGYKFRAEALGNPLYPLQLDHGVHPPRYSEFLCLHIALLEASRRELMLIALDGAHGVLDASTIRPQHATEPTLLRKLARGNIPIVLASTTMSQDDGDHLSNEFDMLNPITMFERMDRDLPISSKAKQGRRQGLHHLVGEDGKTIIFCRKRRGKEAIVPNRMPCPQELQRDTTPCLTNQMQHWMPWKWAD